MEEYSHLERWNVIIHYLAVISHKQWEQLFLHVLILVTVQALT